MMSATDSKAVPDLDEGGYLKDFHKWDEAVARQIAAREGIGVLSGEEMAVIRFMRGFYTQYRSFPMLSAVCRNVHQAKGCVNEEFIDPMKAWKIAGLPEPSPEVLSYLKRE